MKVLTIYGTRPEIIRLSRVIPLIDEHCRHVTVHTGQNFAASLSDVFFTQLGVRQPDIHLGIRASSFAEQAAMVLARVDEILRDERPDRVLILGDTNSALSAIVAARRGIPVFHMEAGNRCFDDRVPEEVNRRIIDHSSTVLLPYTLRSAENLVREGIQRERIYVTGNPIFEVLEHYSHQIDETPILGELSLDPGKFSLVTLHRAENVDDPVRLQRFVGALSELAESMKMPMIISVHPRTAEKLEKSSLSPSSEWIRLLEPLSFFDFVKLEKTARLVLSDSGTVQEECAIFGTPNVTLRDVTERPETIECGSNVLSGSDPSSIKSSAMLALSSSSGWTAPAEYLVRDVSRAVAKVVLGHLSVRRHVDF